MHAIKIPEDWRYGQVREDIGRGRLWKARDRLQGHFVETPADQVVLDLLGSVLYAMGDLPQAGRYWWLTERDDEAARAARAAFHERFGSRSGLVLRALPKPGVPEAYPATVAKRLSRLADQAGGPLDVWGWKDGIPFGNPVFDEPAYDRWVRRRAAFKVVVDIWMFLLAVLGAFTGVGWVISLVNGS
jgi:hypothetical protein